MDNSDKQTSKQTNQQNKKKLKSLEISVAYCCPKPLPLTVRHRQENPMPLEHPEAPVRLLKATDEPLLRNANRVLAKRQDPTEPGVAAEVWPFDHVFWNLRRILMNLDL